MARSRQAAAAPRAPAAPGLHLSRLSAEQRREQLIEVSVDLFSRKGFNGTTTREIAVAAGVTEAVIFRHFETKEHLYRAIIDRRFNSADTGKWSAGLRSAMDRNDDEAVIGTLIGAVIATHKADPKFERLMLYAALEGNDVALQYARRLTASIVESFRAYFSRRQKEGALRAIGPDAALNAIAGMAKGYALSKYVHGLKDRCLSDSEALESFTEIAMRGLLAPGERKGKKRKR